MKILFFALVILNWLVYHKIFAVTYFDLGKGIIQEIITCVLFAGIEIALIMYAGGWLLGLFGGIVGFIGGILGWILRIAIWIARIVLVICLIRWVYKLIKNPAQAKASLNNIFVSYKKHETNTTNDGSVSEEFKEEKTETTIAENEVSGKEVYSEAVEIKASEDIRAYILEHFDIGTRVKAIQYYRNVTGVGLKEAKEQVDIILVEKAKEQSDGRCPNCGLANSAEAKFCVNCGVKL